MKIIVAPDSFKDCLSAKEVCIHISKGILQVYPQAAITEIPLSDGGEGLIEALLDNSDGKLIAVPVQDPIGRSINAEFAIFKDGTTAIIELARASGLELLEEHERNPWITSTYGTGQLIKVALDLGCRKIIVGLGGSATNDGGTGMLKALGARFLNTNGMEISEGGGGLIDLEVIDLTHFDARLSACEVIIASDVSNSLSGENGASLVYGGQKGGDQNTLMQLDKNLQHYGAVIRELIHIDAANMQGAGAAGGTGVALLAFMKGKMVSGIELVLKMVEMEQYLNHADLLITGEGKLDGQTLRGKTIAGISRMAKDNKVPVIVLTGRIGKGIEAIYEMGIAAVFPIVDGPMELKEALDGAPQLLEQTTMNIMRTIKTFSK